MIETFTTFLVPLLPLTSPNRLPLADTLQVGISARQRTARCHETRLQLQTSLWNFIRDLSTNCVSVITPDKKVLLWTRTAQTPRLLLYTHEDLHAANLNNIGLLSMCAVSSPIWYLVNYESLQGVDWLHSASTIR